jgi:membrane-bound lytic murein transglycosylase D
MKKYLIFSTLITICFAGILLFIQSKTSNGTTPTDDYNQLKSRYGIFTPTIPEKLLFANEEVPIKTYFVYEQLDRELLVNTFWQSTAMLYFKRANRWFPTIELILKKNNIPEDFKYLAVIESGLVNATSPAGARGYWQFMKKTGQGYGLQVDEKIDERLDIEKSTQAACDYLKDAYKSLGSWTLAAASYNMGMAGVQGKLKSQMVNSYYDLDLSSETERYVFRILAIKILFENPKAYGFILRECDLYPPLTTQTLEIDSSINDIAQFTVDNKVSYRLFKELNPWLTGNSLPNPTKKVYKIYLPSENLLDYPNLKKSMSKEIGIFGDKK